MDRKEILERVLAINGDLQLLHQELKKFPWDTDFPLVVLSIDDMIDVLNKVIVGNICIDVLEEWADIIECRDDIDFEHQELQEIIFELANPLINGKLTQKRLKEIMDYLISLRL